MKYLLRLAPLFLFLLAGCYLFCSPEAKGQKYLILYPLETSSQTIHIYDGNRFTESGEALKVALAVLNNPLVDNTYADLLIMAANDSEHELPLSLLSARSRSGELEALTPDALAKRLEAGDIFMEKAALGTVTPKAQAYGCSPGKNKDTLSPQTMTPLQKTLIRFQNSYKTHDINAVQSNLLGVKPVAPGTIGGGIVRIRLPALEQDGPMLLKIQAGKKRLSLRLQLQHL